MRKKGHEGGYTSTGERPEGTGPGREEALGGTWKAEEAAGAGGGRRGEAGRQPRGSEAVCANLQALRFKAPQGPGRTATTRREWAWGDVGEKRPRNLNPLPKRARSSPPLKPRPARRAAFPSRRPGGVIRRWAPGQEQARVGVRAHPGRREGPGGAAQAPSFVRDAPGSHAPSIQASSQGPGVGRCPPRLAKRAARHRLKPRPPPLGRRGRGAGAGWSARAAPRGLTRPRDGCSVALDLPYPQSRARQGSHQGPADSSLGVGAHTGPAYCILGGALDTCWKPGPPGDLRTVPGGRGAVALTAWSLQAVCARGWTKRGGRARQGKEGVRKEAAAARRRVIYTFKNEPPAPRGEDLGSVRQHARVTSAPRSPVRTARHLSASRASLSPDPRRPGTTYPV